VDDIKQDIENLGLGDPPADPERARIALWRALCELTPKEYKETLEATAEKTPAKKMMSQFIEAVPSFGKLASRELAQKLTVFLWSRGYDITRLDGEDDGGQPERGD
jgi:hypothetical protein